MTTNNMPDFMIIDDDPINNHICTKYLHLAFPGAKVTAFTNPRQGLEHIQAGSDKEVILLLDINMPILTGWEVLEKFSQFPDEIKKQYRIYILSSSIAHEDKQKADTNPLVSGFIEKPLNIMQLQELLPEYAGPALDI